jgi:hypothetical protein
MLPDSAAGFAAGKKLKLASWPTLTFRVDERLGKIRGMADGQEAMAQAVKIALSVERCRHSILPPDAGAEIAGLLGRDPAEVEGALEERVADALSADDRVLGIEGFEAWQPDGGAEVRAEFTVLTAHGPVRGEVTL